MLVNCKACGKEIGKGVKKCPSCGADQRNLFGKHKIVTGILALIIIGSIGSAMGRGDKTSPTQAPAVPAATTTAPAPAPVPTPVVAAEKKWVVTNSWSGNGAKDTENFAITENTRINWETTDAQGIFQIYIQDMKGSPVGIAANMQGTGKDVSYLHLAPGQYSFKINSAFTPWKITVEQQQ